VTEYKVTLAGTLPKGDPNGLNNQLLAEKLFRTRAEGRVETPVPLVMLCGVRNADHGKDGINTVKVEVLWAEPVRESEDRRAIKGVLAAEYLARTGAFVLPFELSELLTAAFRDLPLTAEEQNRVEAAEQDMMSPTDELRRHLEVVHGVAGAKGLTALEAENRHEVQHAAGAEHALDWHGWTLAERVDRKLGKLTEADPDWLDEDDEAPSGDEGGDR
jgi:hypothetical protein